MTKRKRNSINSNNKNGDKDDINNGIIMKEFYTESRQNGKEDYSLKLDPIFIFPAHIGCIKCVAVSGRYLASGSTDEVIKLYNLKKRKELGSLLKHEGSITTLKFYNKTNMLSGSDDGLICIWRTKDWECLKNLKGHKGRVNSLDIHPTGKIALSVSIDKTDAKVVQKFELKTSRYLCMQYYHHHKNDVDDDLLIVGSEDKLIRIYDVKNGGCILSISGHKNRIKDLALVQSSPPIINNDDDNNKPGPLTILASISSDGIINLWNLDQYLFPREQDNDDKHKQEQQQIKPLSSYDTKKNKR
ncbi:2515_t:CDS:2 [Entrophospora sp. SA101]|nr:2515_t:CDS:2 [Entrophospora sp. SA101]